MDPVRHHRAGAAPGVRLRGVPADAEPGRRGHQSGLHLPGDDDHAADVRCRLRDVAG